MGHLALDPQATLRSSWAYGATSSTRPPSFSWRTPAHVVASAAAFAGWRRVGDFPKLDGRIRVNPLVEPEGFGVEEARLLHHGRVAHLFP